MATDLKQLLSDRLRKLVPLGATSPAYGDYHARVLAVAASKGGVGKTTTAVSLAAGLARFHAKKVLLIDLDPQGHVATSFRAPVPEGTASVSEVLLAAKRRDLIEAAYASPLRGLDLTASDKALGDTENLLATKIGKEFILRGALEIARTHYDFIVIDCPPNLGNLTLNALLAADHLVIPSDLTVLSLEGVGDILATVSTVAERLGHRLEVLGILPTRVDRRNKAMNEVMEQSLRDLYGGFAFATDIPLNTAINRAQLAGETVYEYAPSAKAALAYQAFCEEVLVKLGETVRGVHEARAVSP